MSNAVEIQEITLGIMVSLMPSAGVNPLVSDQFRFQNVKPGDTKISYGCPCGHFVDGNVPSQEQQLGGYQQFPVASGLMNVGQWMNASAMPPQQLYYQDREPTTYTVDLPDVCCSCPSSRCRQHRPPAPTPVSMSGYCDPCLQAGGGPQCCTPQPHRLLQPPGAGWGYCPPIHMDPKSLIRPRDKGLPDKTRPTGAPYFAQEKKPSCPPSEAPKPMKSSFTLKDWLRTVKDREPKDCLRDCCIPSLCTWCAPAYYDCCTDFSDPSSYYLIRQSLPPFY